MTQINPPSSQLTFPVVLGIAPNPNRILFFCPSTGLQLDTNWETRFDWTSTSDVELELDTSSTLAPSNMTSLTAHAALKPFSTLSPSITTSGSKVTLTTAFPSSSTCNTATFEVWIEGSVDSGSNEVIAYVDPTWPVGKASGGGPVQYVANQTDYYYMPTTTKTISLIGSYDGSVNWLQTEYGAMVGKTMVVSPPFGTSSGTAISLTVEVTVGATTESVTLSTTYGTADDDALSYTINGSNETLSIKLLAEATLYDEPTASS